MEPQHYVYGVFRSATVAERAVGSLVNASFEPTDIDVFTLRFGEVQRVSLMHERPIRAGATVGVLLGAVLGFVFGLVLADFEIAERVRPWMWSLFWSLAGGITGAHWGSVFWYTRVVFLPGQERNTEYMVSTTVPAGRAGRAREALERCGPFKQGDDPISGDDALVRHAARHLQMEG